MQVLYILLIILAVLALIYITVTIPYATITIHLKDKKLNIHIKHWIYKKKFEVDLGKKGVETKEKTSPDSLGPDKEKKINFKDKLNEIKKRVLNSEKGIDTEELKNVWNELTEDFNDIYNVFKTFLGKFRHKAEIPLIRINLDYGTDNPATTGMIYGWIWGMVGTLYPIATRYFHIAYPQLDITPDFYGERFDIEIKSIIKVRATHIIGAAIPALWSPAITYLKNKNHKKGRGKNGR